MYSALTNKIRVTVSPQFSADRSNPDEHRYFWSYTVEIANTGPNVVQLMQRFWKITDANGVVEVVQGPGVVGEQPKLGPGKAFRYTSGCPLRTPSGIMSGAYTMIDESGASFDVQIPAFSLDSPFGRRIVN